jgi:TetR/AcrR family macrolide resistance operon transcriptional repressor
MPRPKLHSDTTILDATRTVLKRVGPSDLTLSDVAAEVGISRAALIQRFQNRDNLLRCAMTRNVELTDAYLRDIPCDAGTDGLDKFFQQLCKVLGSGDQYEVNVLIMWHETQDPVLRELALRRQQLSPGVRDVGNDDDVLVLCASRRRDGRRRCVSAGQQQARNENRTSRGRRHRSRPSAGLVPAERQLTPNVK